MADYAPSGSREMVRNVLVKLADKNAVVMANHGALSVGKDIREALTNCEMLEKTAKVYVFAHGLGNINPLPPNLSQG